MDLIPWPAAYGIGGGALVLLITFGIWFLRQLAKGYDPEGKKHGLVPGSAVALLVASAEKRADEGIAAAERRAAEVIALHAELGDEKDKTIAAERDGRRELTGALTAAVESNKIVDDFFTKTQAVTR